MVVSQVLKRGGLSKLSFFDKEFNEQDSYRLQVKEVYTCMQYTLPPISVEYCLDRVSFFFELECSDLPAGTYRGEITNTTLDECYASNIPINVF